MEHAVITPTPFGPMNGHLIGAGVREVVIRANQLIFAKWNSFKEEQKEDRPDGREDFVTDADKEAQKLTLLHTGSIYAGRNPLPVVEALKVISPQGISDGRQLKLRLLGQCLDLKLQRKLESKDFLPWVKIDKPVSYQAAAKATRAADILVLLDSPGRRIGVPAKLYEYIGLRRPILALAQTDSDTHLVLEKSGALYRIVSDWDNIELIRDAITSLVQESKTWSQHGADCLHDMFTREVNASLLADILTYLHSQSCTT